MVFGVSVLNRAYNFKPVCPGPVLDRVWLQDCRLVFGNPKSETLVSVFTFMPTLPDYPGVSRIRNESPGLPYG